ncbi:rhodoquinone biosynthesis methyltransferase RquA [Amantichitinum ursilacus]|uniref:Methyltransferase domain-containing protein n=1 Tax=Amantichitinum ursilacus TaxID=857265 RepID=A0A0N0XGD1_9NEIS|nr:rhodoquinone biosynthesis methyltransferase RquA [Amantichitinum ursilacus]KPC49969.1 hypothetical protein WG78_18975 [Amantichitinum ursilacus]
MTTPPPLETIAPHDLQLDPTHPTPDLEPDHHGVPDYMLEVYDWAYVNSRNVRWLDRNLVVRTLLFGQDQRLMRSYLERLQPGMRVWQVAHVYGDLVQRAARRVGHSGAFHLTDVTPAQVRHARAKLESMPWANVWQSDAARFAGVGHYDVICSFFLLHEVPEDKKFEVVNSMLNQLQPGAEAVFVDYHKPAWWQPIGWLLRGVNAWLEPFAHALWRREIYSYAHTPQLFHWHKRTFFGGVYQCVVATRLPQTGV